MSITMPPPAAPTSAPSPSPSPAVPATGGGSASIPEPPVFSSEACMAMILLVSLPSQQGLQVDARA